LYELVVRLNASRDGRAIIAAVVVVPVLALVAWLNRRSYRRAEREMVTSDGILCRPAAGWVFLGSLAGCGLVVSTVVIVVSSLSRWGFGDVRGLIVLPFGALSIWVGLCLILAMLKYRIILMPDEIRFRGILADKILVRDEIVAKLYIANDSWFLYSSDKLSKKIRVDAALYGAKSRIIDWIKNIPRMDKDHHPPSWDWVYRIRRGNKR
jgi:hypothetical protein